MRFFVGLLALVAGLPAAPTVQPAAAETSGAVKLAYDDDFPDPSVIVYGDRYYAYSTQVRSPGGWMNVPRIDSRDLEEWSSPREALPRLPDWAIEGNTWAPAVVERGGSFLLYYTTTVEANPRLQCISVAIAARPDEQFADTSTSPLVCQKNEGGSIDPYPFADPQGGLYLLWRNNGNAIGKPTVLYARRLASDGRGWAPKSEPVPLLDDRNTQWHRPIGGPAIVRDGDRYVLFYGGGQWNSAGSGIGYATSKKPLGPYTDQTKREPWLGTDPSKAVGPHGPTVFNDRRSRALRIGFSGWVRTAGYPASYRAFWVGQLRFANGRPKL